MKRLITQYTLSVFIIFFMSSCGVKKNKIIIDDKTKKEVLIGECNKKAFQSSFFSEWFNKEYETYDPNKDIINKINNSERLDDIRILIILGTWCGDSRREVPRFFKIVDQLNSEKLHYKLIAIDTKRSSRDNSLNNIEFTRIPTFIFYENGKEIGRIIESTKVSLEYDLLEIISD